MLFSLICYVEFGVAQYKDAYFIALFFYVVAKKTPCLLVGMDVMGF